MIDPHDIEDHSFEYNDVVLKFEYLMKHMKHKKEKIQPPNIEVDVEKIDLTKVVIEPKIESYDLEMVSVDIKNKTGKDCWYFTTITICPTCKQRSNSKKRMEGERPKVTTKTIFKKCKKCKN